MSEGDADPSKIYSTTIRAEAISAASVTIWICCFLKLVEPFGARFHFLALRRNVYRSFFFCLQIVPETQGRTLEEPQASW